MSSRPQQAIVVVDPVSTGATVALEAYQRGYVVLALWTAELGADFRGHVPLAVANNLEYHAELEEEATLAETAATVREACIGLDLMAVICGTESGVKVTDAVSEYLGLRTNGTALSGARRNKSAQQAAIKSNGLRSVREVCGIRWEEVEDFVTSEALPLIVKPVESAGSDGVKLCLTAAEVKEHFVQLIGEQRKFGAQDAGVLIQEYLRGTEYVIDHVSRDGVHKTTMIWVYDKRPLNGAGSLAPAAWGWVWTRPWAAPRPARAQG